jgi:hypothetical protein
MTESPVKDRPEGQPTSVAAPGSIPRRCGPYTDAMDGETPLLYVGAAGVIWQSTRCAAVSPTGRAFARSYV